MKRYLTILFSTLFWYGCQDAEVIPFGADQEKFVVEGWLTDRLENQYVRISTSVPFASSKKLNAVEGAIVEVTELRENEARSFSYTDAGDGLYLSQEVFAGVPGRSYLLQIALPTGERIVSSTPEMMNSVNPIDSLGYDFFMADSEEDPGTEIKVYYPIATTTDPPETHNYYRWKLYRNDTLFSKASEIFLFDDRFINGNDGQYSQEFTSYNYKLFDTIRAERMALSQRAYNFLSLLKAQTTSIGTNSAVSPAAITGNLSMVNSSVKVLGFFGAISVTTRETVIVPGEDNQD